MGAELQLQPRADDVSASSASRFTVRRKCACGSTAGFDDRCDSCRDGKKARRKLLEATAPPAEVSVGAADAPEEADTDRAAAAVVRRLAGEEDAPPIAGLAPAATAIRLAEDPAPVAPDAGGLIVEDEALELTSGQMRKGPFIRELRREACEAADAELASAGRSTRGCPLIERWLATYAGRPAEHLERVLRRYAPETRGASTARELIAPVVARIRRGVAEWARSGRMPDVPEDLRAMAMGQASGAVALLAGIGGAVMGIGRAIGGLFFRAEEGGARAGVDRVALEDRLGPGRPLDGAPRGRMERAFGVDFGTVRLHADPDAARLSEELHARAFTLGRHVAFAPGEYRPGTPDGDALLAHELAHVVQQGGGAARARVDDAPREADERDADVAAAGAVVELHAPDPRRPRRPLARRLNGAPRLQRCGGPSRGPDRRAGARLPHDEATREGLLGELGMQPPVAGGSGAAAQWDGIVALPDIDAATAATNRTALRDTLLAELTTHLADRADDLTRLHERDANRVGVRPFLGPCDSAKGVVDRRFSGWASPTEIALTEAQAGRRRGHRFQISGAGQNIFDAADPATLTRFGIDTSAEFRVKKLLQETHANLAAARGAMDAHHFFIDRTPEERDFLRTEVQEPFAAAHRADLDVITRLAYARALSDQGIVLLQTDVPGGTAADPGDQPSDGERRKRWSVFEVCAHEYIHTLSHPNFNRATRGRNAPKEIFTSFFTREALEPIMPDGISRDTRVGVEGGDWGADTSLIGTFETPRSYQGFLARADNMVTLLTAAGTPGGAQNAMKAAYFQGHVEYIGIDPASRGTAGPIGPPDHVTVPPGITTRRALAVAAGVTEDEITAENPAITAASTLTPGQVVKIIGARDHIVIGARNDADDAAADTVETRGQIARQHGVTEAELDRANPSLVRQQGGCGGSTGWTSLSEGQRILIPRRPS